MDLRGTPLVVLLAILTVVAPVAVCLVWSRVRGPRILRAATRGAMLATSQLVAIVLVAVLINDYAEFYRSWSEVASGASRFLGLTTTVNRPPQLSITGDHSAVPGGLRVDGRRGDTKPADWSRTGELESVTISGTYTGLRSHAFVYLPPEYFQAAYRNAYFPVIEVFTGYPGVDDYLVSRLRYPDVLRQVVQRHRAHPAVLVMMRPSVTFPRDTECTDVPQGPQAEMFFAVDVPAVIATHYRVTTSGWGAIGDSTGGYCAVKLAMMNAAMFPAAAELSGYFFALRDHTTGDLWGGSTVIRHLNDLAWRARHLHPPPVDLLEATSPSEPGADGYHEALRFARLVRAPMHVTLLTVPHGGHNFATWNAELPIAINWLCAHLPAPGPSPSPPAPVSRDLGLA